MTDFAVKKKIWRIKKRAIQLLIDTGWDTRLLDGEIFHIEATRKHSETILKIRIEAGEPKEGIIKEIKSIDLPTNCKKEIWHKESGSRKFNILSLNGS